MTFQNSDYTVLRPDQNVVIFLVIEKIIKKKNRNKIVSYICPTFRIATQTLLLPCGKDQFTVLILKFGIEAHKKSY